MKSPVDRSLSWIVCVKLFAQRGRHCRSAELIYRGNIPKELQAECDAAHAEYVKPENVAKRQAENDAL